MVLLRFAPSPTGPLHLGGLRTALFNHLFARKHGGKWILRIEDTDAKRFVKDSYDGIKRALEWAGLDYDFGPSRGGPHAPYLQSERLALYHQHADKLLNSGHAYRCFCTPDELLQTRENLTRSGSHATYDKKCLHLSEEEVARRQRAGEKSIIRLNDGMLPDRATPADLIFGQIKDTHKSMPTDPVLLKNDLFPTYHLASVVDDHTMGITHVFRGEEWLPSIAFHLDLYAILGWKPPKYAHLPILVNADGSKMSKRKGDVSVAEYIKRGWEPDAVLNWLALAGWGSNSASPLPADATSLSLAELTERFDISSLTNKRNAMDYKKLEQINRNHIMRQWEQPGGLERQARSLQEPLRLAFPASPYLDLKTISNVIRVMAHRMIVLEDIVEMAPFFFVDPDMAASEHTSMMKGIDPSIGAQIRRDVAQSLQDIEEESWEAASFQTILQETQKNGHNSISGKVFMTTLRAALSGQKIGPSISEILATLGKTRSLERLRV